MATIDISYYEMDTLELTRRINRHKTEFGRRLCIMAHHYQNDAIVRYADFVGDSLYLSRKAAEHGDAEFIIFCGVKFMAEAADILSGGHQKVYLPNLAAGCAMSDMAEAEDVEIVLNEITNLLRSGRVIPISYVNSSAGIKAITCDWDGSCCTSSNVKSVLEWAIASSSSGCEGADKIMGLPDRHLMLNTIISKGYGPDDCAVYDPALPYGGFTEEKLARVKFILWPGHCYVHDNFSLKDIMRIRRDNVDVQIVAHPECSHEVVMASDMVGSTTKIIDYVAAQKSGSNIAIGTEINLVRRLARMHSDKNIFCLAESGFKCVQMAKIDLQHLLWSLEAISAGRPVNLISVPEITAQKARVALERMIHIAQPDSATSNNAFIAMILRWHIVRLLLAKIKNIAVLKLFSCIFSTLIRKEI